MSLRKRCFYISRYIYMCRLLLFVALGCLCGLSLGRSATLISNEDLNNSSFFDIPQGSTPALVFIIPTACSSCQRFSKLLDEFVSDSFYTGRVYFSNGSHLTGVVGKPPLILMSDAERSIPYCGPLHQTHLLNAIHQFSNGVRSALLDDANFEHDTQATTGSTTGDWLIVFDHLKPSIIQLYDGLSLSLRTRGISIGLVDPRHSVRTAKRFDFGPKSSEPLPSVLLLRRSQMYRLPGPISHSSACDLLLQFALNDYTNYEASVIPRPRMRFDEFVDWCVESVNALEVQYGSTTVLLFGATILFITLSSIALLLVTCFWWAGGFEHPAEQSSQAELDENEIDVGHPSRRATGSRRTDQSPHEAGDDGGAHRLRKPKRE